jgi:hypothetical protein
MMSEVVIQEGGSTKTSCGESAKQDIGLNEKPAGLERENPPWAKTKSIEYSEREVTKGFISALEYTTEDELPAFVKQHDNTLTFPEKVGACDIEHHVL